MSAKIWLITSGCYSGYGVEAAFSSEEAAKLYMATYHANDRGGDYGYRIEEFPLDPQVEAMRDGLLCFRVIMEVDGSLRYPPELSASDGEVGVKLHPRNRPPTFAGYINAKTAEAAVKIANEQRLMLLAAADQTPQPSSEKHPLESAEETPRMSELPKTLFGFPVVESDTMQSPVIEIGNYTGVTLRVELSKGMRTPKLEGWRFVSRRKQVVVYEKIPPPP